MEKTFQWDKRVQEGEIDRTEVFTNIGLNTGHVIIGNIGPDKRLTLTVMGDNVDLASCAKTWSVPRFPHQRSFPAMLKRKIRLP